MVYYIGSLRKIRFNRNILYCKYSHNLDIFMTGEDLIETFCIVNIDKDNKIYVYKDI